jgi:hypothetical protein
MSSALNSPAPLVSTIAVKKRASSTPCQPVFIVDPETASVDLNPDSVWMRRRTSLHWEDIIV